MSDSDERASRLNSIGWDTAINKGKNLVSDKARASEAKILTREQKEQPNAPYIKPSVEAASPENEKGEQARLAGKDSNDDKFAKRTTDLARMLGGSVKADSDRGQRALDRSRESKR